ncbi:MAG: M20/M25/M40 family metallo-hydrolase [Desulfobulbaceae bacterium]|nr:M20/M25/M40 family metallo-hydrolase [Desulfobulbaceae bacterium]
MKISVNEERLASSFITLCEIDSPSRQEGAVAHYLKERFAELGCEEIFEDDSAKITGSNCGNLFVRFAGTSTKEPIFLNCHMDTVEPSCGVKVRFRDGIFTSSSDTILGSDDKSGIAAILEAIRLVRENDVHIRPVELVFTTCEEIGLLGAKALDPQNIEANMGYSLDSTGFGKVIIGAPASNHFSITVQGVAAHAGLHPEWGVNAITLAARALAKVPNGRIDPESSVNIGVINGGAAVNIVPEKVVVEGEIRSHSLKTLQDLTRRVVTPFEEVVNQWSDPTGLAKGKPTVNIEVTESFPLMYIRQNDAVVKEIDAVAKAMGLELEYDVAGGGSDANIFNGYGLSTAIVATGMTHVHSTDEQVSLQDMKRLTELVLALMSAD